MEFVADLHIHSRYSLATSKALSPTTLHMAARRKGITVLGTGDFTHPAWIQELKNHLEPAEPGFFRLRKEHLKQAERTVPTSCRGEVRFVLQAEISNIYKKAGKTRKVHNLVYAPDFETAARIAKPLGKLQNLASDGRPIVKMDSAELLKIVLAESDRSFLVPAHIWTPHFSVLGAFSDFGSLEECYGESAKHIFAVETGLSSDPPMNWRVSSLDRVALVSNSDAHSPDKLAREANLFDTALSYDAMVAALKAKNGKTFRGTIEFFPAEGKYHLDGHRACGVCLTPAETRKHSGCCPACGKEITKGVCHRVEALADRPEGARPKGALPYESLIALRTVLSEAMSVGPASKRVGTAYEKMLAALGPELFVLRQAPLEDIAAVGVHPRAAKAVGRMRRGEVSVAPGYDGQYGVVCLLP